ncbi:MAG: stage III sporulation protein AB [Oscillospiraceae bacterium]|nr:stage III sporulation protein AB [Oscillospiraceae bacterium]
MDKTTPYTQSAIVLPRILRDAAARLTNHDAVNAEEFRLRVGQALSVVVNNKEIALPVTVEREHLELLIETVTRGSYYAVSEQLRCGYVTIEGGHRVGWTGTAVVKDGNITALRDFSGACVRIARQVKGVAGSLMAALCPEQKFVSTLILSPPGAGKTTLLRDIIRMISGGSAVCAAHRVSLCDERGEVAALWQGKPCFDVGARTDVLNGGTKAENLLMLLRSMAPQVIALDEITAPSDAEALRQCAHCGVELLATAHANNAARFFARPGGKALKELFKRVVLIDRQNGKRRYSVRDEAEALIC